MKYEVFPTKKYKKGYQKLVKQKKNMNLLTTAVTLLAEGKQLGPEYNDHPLKENFKGYRECHIGGPRSNWILLYKIINDTLVLELTNTGTHGDVFGGEELEDFPRALQMPL